MTSVSTPRPRGRALPAWPAVRPLRAWQHQALNAWRAHSGEAFLASATPAAGKTTFGLRAAYEALASGRVQRVVVAAPTTHICRQWALDAARYGIDLEPANRRLLPALDVPVEAPAGAQLSPDREVFSDKPVREHAVSCAGNASGTAALE